MTDADTEIIAKSEAVTRVFQSRDWNLSEKRGSFLFHCLMTEPRIHDNWSSLDGELSPDSIYVQQSHHKSKSLDIVFRNS